RDELGAAVDDQVLAELVAPVHLEHQAAEVPDPLLAEAQEGPPVPPQLARWRTGPPHRCSRRRRGRSGLASEERHRAARLSLDAAVGDGRVPGRALTEAQDEQAKKHATDDS